MKLGILVNSDRHWGHLLGLAAAATAKNHEVVIFVMDQGTRLLDNESFAELAGLEGVSLSVCDHSAQQRGIDTGAVADTITIGGQFNNAMMAHEADRVIVL